MDLFFECLFSLVYTTTVWIGGRVGRGLGSELDDHTCSWAKTSNFRQKRLTSILSKRSSWSKSIPSFSSGPNGLLGNGYTVPRYWARSTMFRQRAAHCGARVECCSRLPSIDFSPNICVLATLTGHDLTGALVLRVKMAHNYCSCSCSMLALPNELAAQKLEPKSIVTQLRRGINVYSWHPLRVTLLYPKHRTPIGAWNACTIYQTGKAHLMVKELQGTMLSTKEFEKHNGREPGSYNYAEYAETVIYPFC